MIYSIMILMFGIVFGSDISIIYSMYIEDRLVKKSKDEVNSVYTEVLQSIISRSKFIDRINNNITISIKMKNYGVVNIMYLMDKKDIALFLDDNCIFTSENVDKDIIDSIINTINSLYSDNIKDSVIVMGILYYRPAFEEKFNVKVSDLQKNKMSNEKSDIENIINSNDKKFDIDIILDKINDFGVDNLSESEKKFLENYNK